MQCPSCQTENTATAKFCSECGTKLQAICPQCGTPAAPAAKFCSGCGAALNVAATSRTPAPPRTVSAGNDAAVAAARPTLQQQFSSLHQVLPRSLRERLLTPEQGENRVVTVFFADMSGSVERTRDMTPEAGADLVNELLRAMVDALVKYDGRVDRMLGDGVLAEFGTPQAHEDDPERAILAAIEIRDAAQKLGLKITCGINTGGVFVGGLGNERYSEITVMGPVVNLAARFQKLAQPGQILVGEATYRHARRSFEFETLPPAEAKGFADAVRAYAVLRALPRQEKVRGIEGLRAQLIGREKELGALVDAADSLVQERRGQIATVVGEAGIGKSRLVTELKEYVAGKDVLWLEGRCISISQSVGFWPFIDLLRTYLGIAREDSEAEIGQKVVRGIAALFPQDAEGIVPYVGHLLSVKLDERYEERLRHASPEQLHRQTLLRVRDVFVALARRRPIVAVFEDLHWADALSLDLLWVLMDELVAAPIFLVCVYRPEREHPSWQIDATASGKFRERHTHLALQPLSQVQSQQMVESLLNIHNLPPAAKATILERTEGNPFYVEEVLRLLIDQGAVYQEDGQWKARDAIGEVHVPDTIKSVILTRIDRLQGEVKYVLQCASVIGRVFQRSLLEYLAGQSDSLEAHIALLETHELVYKERIVPELEYAFRHALTQETAYEGMLARHRREFHARIGEAIEALYTDQLDEYFDLLAFHYSRSDDRAKALEYQWKAARKAAARFANDEALRYYAQALELASGGSSAGGTTPDGQYAGEYDDLLFERAQLHLDRFAGGEAAADFEKLLERARDRGSRRHEVEALIGQARASYILALDKPESDYAGQSRAQYEAAYALAKELSDKRAMARALVWSHWFTDFWPEYREQARANLQEALTLAREVGDDELILDARLGMLPYLPQPEQYDTGERLLADLQARGDLPRLNTLYFHLMWSNLRWGAFRRAVEICDAGTQVAREMGVPPVQYASLKALALVWLGEYAAAWESLQQETADEAHPFGKAMRDWATVVLYLDVAANERAAELGRGVLAQAERLKRAWMQRSTHSLVAIALARQITTGRAGEALNDEARAHLERGGLDGAIIVLPRAAAAELALVEGRLDDALVYSRQAVSEGEERGRTRELVPARALQARVLLALGDVDEASRTTDDALALAERCEYRPMLWRLHATKSAILEKQGNASGAAAARAAAGDILRALLADLAKLGDAELTAALRADPQAVGLG